MKPITNLIEVEKLVMFLKREGVFNIEDEVWWNTPEQNESQLRHWVAMIDSNLSSFLVALQCIANEEIRYALRRACIAQEYGVDEKFVSDKEAYVSEVNDDFVRIHTPQGDFTFEPWGTLRE